MFLTVRRTDAVRSSRFSCFSLPEQGLERQGDAERGVLLPAAPPCCCPLPQLGPPFPAGLSCSCSQTEKKELSVSILLPGGMLARQCPGRGSVQPDTVPWPLCDGALAVGTGSTSVIFPLTCSAEVPRIYCRQCPGEALEVPDVLDFFACSAKILW